MADAKISQLPAATTPLAGTEKAEIVQGGVNKQVDVSEFGGGTVTSVTGTTNRITSTGGATPVIDIDAAYDAAVTAEIAAAGNSKSNALITLRTETASYTLDATDLANINAGHALKIRMNVASANVLTIPLNATQAFQPGTQIIIQQIGVGQTSIAITATGTLNSANGWLNIAYQYASVVITKIGTNEWDVEGTLAP